MKKYWNYLKKINARESNHSVSIEGNWACEDIRRAGRESCHDKVWSDRGPLLHGHLSWSKNVAHKHAPKIQSILQVERSAISLKCRSLLSHSMEWKNSIYSVVV